MGVGFSFLSARRDWLFYYYFLNQAAVDDCLRFGLILKKPVLFNREPPTYSLLKEVARSLPEARDVVRRVQELEESASGFGGYGHVFSLSTFSYADSVRLDIRLVTLPLLRG